MGAEGGLDGRQEGVCGCMKGGGLRTVSKAGVRKNKGKKTVTAMLEYRLSSEYRPPDCVMLREGCSWVSVTLPFPAHPDHPWLPERMVKLVGPLGGGSTALTQPLLK